MVGRADLLASLGSAAAVVGVLAARGDGSQLGEWRGASTALLGWAVVVEVGRGGGALASLAVVCVVACVIARFASATPVGELVSQTVGCVVVAGLYAAAPLFWMVSRPARTDEDADTKVGT